MDGEIEAFPQKGLIAWCQGPDKEMGGWFQKTYFSFCALIG